MSSGARCCSRGREAPARRPSRWPRSPPGWRTWRMTTCSCTPHPEPVAWNMYGTAKLDAGHLARFPQLAGAVSISADPVADEKAVLDVQALLPHALASSLPIRAVLLPRIRGGRARLRRASAGAGAARPGPQHDLPDALRRRPGRQLAGRGGAPRAGVWAGRRRRPRRAGAGARATSSITSAPGVSRRSIRRPSPPGSVSPCERAGAGARRARAGVGDRPGLSGRGLPGRGARVRARPGRRPCRGHRRRRWLQRSHRRDRRQLPGAPAAPAKPGSGGCAQRRARARER